MTLGILWAVPNQLIPIEPMYEVTPHQHITLWHKCQLDEVRSYIGLSGLVYLQEVGWNSEIQAVKVILQEGLPFRKEIPHLTISHREGVKPITATEMLKGKSDRVIHIGETIGVTLKFHELEYQD